MPELPEVENVVRRIRTEIIGKTIHDVSVQWPRTVGGISPKKFSAVVTGRVVTSVGRRGKYILISLDPPGYLIVHLRMSGDILLGEDSPERDKHLRVKLHLSNGVVMRFIDARKFGRFTYCEDLAPLIKRLGPEPIDNDFNLEAFCQRLKTTSRPIKSVLLDQQWVAGLGNIYVLESLWRAGVDPRTQASKLSRIRLERLMHCAREVLLEAIESHGTDLGDGVWKTGTFVPQIYGRAGSPCLRCSAEVQKIRLAQRGTEFCPRCQKQ